MVAQLKSLREQLVNCQLPAEQAFSIPPECYTSEELLQEELEKNFSTQLDRVRACRSFCSLRRL